jgi:cellobiose-specific phosphotransferase system component IIB
MDEKLKSTIDKIVQLSKQNPEFDAELRKRLEITSSANVVSSQMSICDDVHAIRETLEIRANNSISYDFILAKGNQRLRDQLLIDNLRMENAALNLKEKELERFYSFCANAFYQIENVVNFYFYVMFPNIDNLLSFIENATNVDGKYSFKRNANKEYKSVRDIEITYKLNAICTTLFPDDKNIKITYSQLRQVRNEGAHRCMVIVEEHDESNALYRFFKYNTFNSIRIVLIKLVGTIKQEIENVDKIIKKRGVIVNVLPSIAFIKVEGKRVVHIAFSL